MGKFVRNIEVEQEFDGDSVRFVCKPMDRPTALALFGFKKEKAFEDDGITPIMEPDSSKQAETLSNEAVQFLANAFEKHVESVTGARDANGNALSKEDVFGSAYFFAMTSAAAAEWSARSFSGNR